MLSVVSYGIGTLLGFILVACLVFWLVRDIVQKKHAVLRNYPLIGRMRYLLERQGEFLRQYLFAGDRDEMPFNRATRSWVYRTSKGLGGNIGFGSTNDLDAPGNLIFVNAAFPTLEQDHRASPPRVIGEGYCNYPFEAKSLVNISGMSFGAISAPAVRALARGAAEAGCWLNTGEGGLSPYHEVAGADLIFQIGTANYGVRDAEGRFSKERALGLAGKVKAFEIKLSQGAKPGKGGVLPAAKVIAEIAGIRGIAAGVDSLSPSRHADIADIDQLLDRIMLLRDLTGRPVGIKTAIGGWQFINELCERINARGHHCAPDFITIDGGEGGSGAAPQVLADHMGLSIMEALPRMADALIESGLRQRIRLIAAGKLVTPAKAAWALCCGADFINTARGFMFAMGCIQAMRCHTNTCPTGITTHNKRLQRGLVVEEKYLRVAQYARTMNQEIEMIAHSCGLAHARELSREHVRLVQAAGRSVALNMLYPYPKRAARE